MSLRLIHLLDDRTCEDAARLCSLLLRKLPAGEASQQVIVTGRSPVGLDLPQGTPAAQIARPLVWPFLTCLPLQRRLKQERFDVLIAWSPVAAATAGSALSDRLIAVAADPADVREWARWRSAVGGSGFPLICTTGTLRRRLVEAGLPRHATAVIRPGIDFAELRRARECMRRDHLGVPGRARILLAASPASRAGGQYYAAWAAAILHHIWPDAVLVIPGVSREQRRIARLVSSIYCPGVYRLTEHRYSPAELMAVADGLIVPALDDAPMGYVPWAMAAGVPVIGSAVPCVTEFIADRSNGFLCRPGEPHTLAVRIRTAFEAPDVMAGCVQTSRHQAYETFRAERCVDEFRKALDNVAAGRPALAGLEDAAMDA